MSSFTNYFKLTMKVAVVTIRKDIEEREIKFKKWDKLLFIGYIIVYLKKSKKKKNQ